MSIVSFKSCKIGASIPLDKPAAFFRLLRSSRWREYLLLGPEQLADILKQDCSTKRVYLFAFGCITFVDFNESDMQVVLDFLSGMIEPVDYSMVARYAESHLIEVDEEGQFLPWSESDKRYRFNDATVSLIAILLAKATALNKIEADIDANMDESGEYIELLQRGRLSFNKKASMVILSKFLKFEFESINQIRIFDRSVADMDSLSGRELHDKFAEYYELYDRFDVLQRKIGSLRTTMKSYNSLSYRKNENRLYLFEIFLLALFPLASILRLFLHF